MFLYLPPSSSMSWSFSLHAQLSRKVDELQGLGIACLSAPFVCARDAFHALRESTESMKGVRRRPETKPSRDTRYFVRVCKTQSERRHQPVPRWTTTSRCIFISRGQVTIATLSKTDTAVAFIGIVPELHRCALRLDATPVMRKRTCNCDEIMFFTQTLMFTQTSQTQEMHVREAQCDLCSRFLASRFASYCCEEILCLARTVLSSRHPPLANMCVQAFERCILLYFGHLCKSIACAWRDCPE